MSPVQCSIQCCTYIKRKCERGKILVCVSELLSTACLQQQSTQTRIFLSHIFSWCMCSSVYSTELESCKILQSLDTISKMLLNFTFWIKCFCVCKWNVTSDSHMTWGYNNFCITIIPYTRRKNGTPWGHFRVIREGSYDYKTHANRFYGSNIV